MLSLSIFRGHFTSNAPRAAPMSQPASAFPAAGEVVTSLVTPRLQETLVVPLAPRKSIARAGPQFVSLRCSFQDHQQPCPTPHT